MKYTQYTIQCTKLNSHDVQFGVQACCSKIYQSHVQKIRIKLLTSYILLNFETYMLLYIFNCILFKNENLKITYK